MSLVMTDVLIKMLHENCNLDLDQFYNSFFLTRAPFHQPLRAKGVKKLVAYSRLFSNKTGVGSIPIVDSMYVVG